ncbi:MAG TPA: hypothetical protein VND01_00735, partial [Candidatus Acidoferrales bacterium]|nr:hypothetical protein [Candidatus Acidoferrales bacterium]
MGYVVGFRILEIKELWQMDLLCKRPEKTWNEAAVLWLNETTHKATQIRDREILNWLEPYL